MQTYFKWQLEIYEMKSPQKAVPTVVATLFLPVGKYTSKGDSLKINK